MSELENIPILDLSDTGVPDHDQAATIQAGRLIQIGALEYEISAYGTAVYDEDDVYYFISAREESMVDFVNECCLKGLYPAPVKYFYKRYDLLKIPEEAVRANFRMYVAKELQKNYPKEMFASLQRLTKPFVTNAAMPIVQELMRQLDSCFDQKQLNIFDSLLRMLLSARMINLEGYEIARRWLDHEVEKISQEPSKAGTYQRTYAGFAYRKPNGETAFFMDAFSYMATERQTAMLSQGVITTPILTFDYFADDYNQLEVIRNQYREDLKVYLGGNYLNVMDYIRSLPPSVNPELFQQEMEQLKGKVGKTAMDAMKYYGYLWNVLQ